MMQSALTAASRVLLLAGAAVVLLALLLLATGHDVPTALGALVRGSVGSSYAFFSTTAVRAVPLALAGLAIALAFRAGILNIGAEGQLLIGATAGATVAALVAGGSAVTASGAASSIPAPLVVVLIVLAGACGGAVWAGAAAWLRRQFGVLEVISTIMLNYIAINIVGYLVRGPLQEPARINPQSEALPVVWQLPALATGSRLHLGVLVAIALAVALWWWLRATAGGFRLRAAGANASAAFTAGRIDVAATTTAAFLVSGALAGLAGSVQYAGVTYALYENFSPGYGYTAIAVALLARLNPLGVLGTALLFGALQAGGNAMQRDAGVPSVVVSVVEATLILLVVAVDRAQWGGAARESTA